MNPPPARPVPNATADDGGGVAVPDESRFVWPPRSPVADPIKATPVGRAPASVSSQAAPSVDLLVAPARGQPWGPARGAWAEIETAWFGLVSGRLTERAAHAGWKPDDAAAYCPRCGHRVGPFDADARGCSQCRGSRLPWEAFVRLGTYEPPLSPWVREVKFGRQRVLGRDLGRMLGAALMARIAAGAPRPEQILIVPVPTSAINRMARGIDHPLQIAHGVADAAGGIVCEVLSRRHGWSQTSVAASDRAANVAGRLRRSRMAWMLAGLPFVPVRLVPSTSLWRSGPDDLVIVVDDIMTTGATLRAACRQVLGGLRVRGGPRPRIWCATVAVTPSPFERGRLSSGDQMFGE